MSTYYQIQQRISSLVKSGLSTVNAVRIAKAEMSLSKRNQQGITLTELLLSLAIIGMLSGIFYPVILRIIWKVRLNAAIANLSAETRVSRYDALEGKTRSLCVRDEGRNLKYMAVEGNCEGVTNWNNISKVDIDYQSSTLPGSEGLTQAGGSGHNGSILRMSWKGEHNGAQLGRLCLVSGIYRASLVLNNTYGNVKVELDNCGKK